MNKNNPVMESNNNSSGRHDMLRDDWHRIDGAKRE